MQKYIGAIDQGTSSTRFIIFDHAGNIISQAAKEHRQIYPKPGWVEHDPLEILANTNEVIGAALARANLTASNLAAAGITNQREPARRFATLWSGWTPAQMRWCITTRPKAGKTAFALKPACRSQPISPASNCFGF